MTSHLPTGPSAAERPRRNATDEEIILAACEQDQDAWRELVHRYGPLVYSIPVRYGMDREDCDDVFQEVFAILLNGLSSVRDAKRLPKWLITTTHRTAWRILRANDREPAAAHHGEVSTAEGLENRYPGADPPAEPPPETAWQWERRHLVHEALGRLDERCRTLLTALYRTPTPPDYETIARDLGIPKGSIGPTRGRCLDKLLAMLRKMNVEW